MDALTPGRTGEARRTVTPGMTARALGSGDVDVFGTPALLALIEEAAVAALHGALDEDETSVGSWVELSHLAPSRVGNEVRAIARLVEVDGKKLAFECEAFDGSTTIAHALHRRAVVPRARFA